MTPRSTYHDRLAPLAALLQRSTMGHLQDMARRIFGPDEGLPDGTVVHFSADLHYHPLAKGPSPELRIEATATTPGGREARARMTLREDHLQAELDPEGSLWRAREVLAETAVARLPR